MTLRHKHFICSCASRKEAAEEVYQRALHLMDEDGKELLGGYANEKNFVSAAVSWLWWEYQISITGLPTDQWSAVTAKKQSYVNGELVDDITYYIECDQIEHGFAYLLVDAPKTVEEANAVTTI